MPIVIIGGGVIGSAIAYFLTLQQPELCHIWLKNMAKNMLNGHVTV